MELYHGYICTRLLIQIEYCLDLVSSMFQKWPDKKCIMHISGWFSVYFVLSGSFKGLLMWKYLEIILNPVLERYLQINWFLKEGSVDFIDCHGKSNSNVSFDLLFCNFQKFEVKLLPAFHFLLFFINLNILIGIGVNVRYHLLW